MGEPEVIDLLLSPLIGGSRPMSGQEISAMVLPRQTPCPVIKDTAKEKPMQISRSVLLDQTKVRLKIGLSVRPAKTFISYQGLH